MVEVHAFDAQWSEHCSYKSSRVFLRTLPTEGPEVVLGPGEDAGVLHLGEWHGERYGVVVAHESHNHPSQVVPFEGAATGVGGIVRDVLCMGAEVVALADCLRFGDASDQASHQCYVARGAVDGIAAYGNAIGVPNIAGDVYFHNGFNDNCLVNVVAVGLLKESEIVHSAAPPGSAGWDIVLVGKATDASGFGGASFSSGTLDEANAQANKGAVQVPDPFLKNVIMRASYRVFELLRERKITAGFKDLGAGGIMGCSAELCGSGGFGAIVDLDDVNVAVENLPPEVIAVGETQERLCWVLPGGVTSEVLRIYNEEFSLPEMAFNARATVIGAVQSDRRYVLRHGGGIVMDVPIDVLTGSIHDRLPSSDFHKTPLPDPSLRFLRNAPDLQQLLPRVLAHLDVCSRRPLYERYDAVVRGTTAIARGAADAGVIVPIAGAPLALALSVAGNPRYGRVEPWSAAVSAVYEAVRKVVAVGARPIGFTDCLNFGNPRNQDHYGALAQTSAALAFHAREFGLPFVSGNVSLYNESSSGTAIPASAILACIGAMDDIARVVTPDFKKPGSALYFVGLPSNLLGGAVVCEFVDAMPSALAIDPAADESSAVAFMLRAAAEGLLASARSVGDGGMLAAVAKMAFASRNAFGVDLTQGEKPAHVGLVEWLFGESGGWLVEAADARAFEGLAADVLPRDWWHRAGVTTPADVEGEVDILAGDASWDLDSLYRTWSEPLQKIFA